MPWRDITLIDYGDSDTVPRQVIDGAMNDCQVLLTQAWSDTFAGETSKVNIRYAEIIRRLKEYASSMLVFAQGEVARALSHDVKPDWLVQVTSTQSYMAAAGKPYIGSHDVVNSQYRWVNQKGKGGLDVAVITNREHIFRTLLLVMAKGFKVKWVIVFDSVKEANLEFPRCEEPKKWELYRSYPALIHHLVKRLISLRQIFGLWIFLKKKKIIHP